MPTNKGERRVQTEGPEYKIGTHMKGPVSLILNIMRRQGCNINLKHQLPQGVFPIHAVYGESLSWWQIDPDSSYSDHVEEIIFEADGQLIGHCGAEKYTAGSYT